MQASLLEQREIVRAKKISPAELDAECRRRIEELNPKINAFIALLPPQKISAPPEAPLYGLPIAVKDLFDVAGFPTTAGSKKFFAQNIAAEDSAAVAKLKAAGAQLPGKTNTHEIALGVTNNNPHYGACRNPWNKTRISGGSSGGSAAAVAAGMVSAAIGTDTGGSIRIPASLCGVVGFKPTFGRISMKGVFPLSWNLDHVGTLTRTVADAALLLQVLSGYDERDPASAPELADEDWRNFKQPVAGARIAFAMGNFIEEVSDPETLECVQRAAATLRTLGARVTDYNADFLREAAAANGLMVQADAAAVHRERLKEHPDWFGADVRQRLQMGAAFTAVEYALARRTQSEIKRKLALFFRDFEALILPATPIPAPPLEGEDALERARLLTRFTAPFNLTGLPAMSLPCGFTRAGLPIGLQIVSRAWSEATVLRVAHSLEQAAGLN